MGEPEFDRQRRQRQDSAQGLARALKADGGVDLEGGLGATAAAATANKTAGKRGEYDMQNLVADLAKKGETLLRRNGETLLRRNGETLLRRHQPNHHGEKKQGKQGKQKTSRKQQQLQSSEEVGGAAGVAGTTRPNSAHLNPLRASAQAELLLAGTAAKGNEPTRRSAVALAVAARPGGDKPAWKPTRLCNHVSTTIAESFPLKALPDGAAGAIMYRTERA